MSLPVHISVQEADFSCSEEEQRLQQAGTSIGAVVAFTGYVRDNNEGAGVKALHLEHYPGMTEKSIKNICHQAAERWPLLSISVIHRVGELKIGDRIVYVGVSSAHRGAAFEAGEFIMDFLKTSAPFWKKEYTSQGERWVEARTSDDAARDRW